MLYAAIPTHLFVRHLGVLCKECETNFVKTVDSAVVKKFIKESISAKAVLRWCATFVCYVGVLRWCATLVCYVRVLRSCATFVCYVRVLRSCATFVCYVRVLRSCATFVCYVRVLRSCATFVCLFFHYIRRNTNKHKNTKCSYDSVYDNVNKLFKVRRSKWLTRDLQRCSD